jgi:hypothetical protein
MRPNHLSKNRAKRVSNKNGHMRSRCGYALLACLLTIAVCSSIVIAIFNIQRVHCAEAGARRHLAIAEALSQAAREHAIAVLIDQPAFRGGLGPFVHPDVPGRGYRFQITQAGTDVQITGLITTDGQVSATTWTLPYEAIDTRRAALGLQP